MDILFLVVGILFGSLASIVAILIVRVNRLKTDMEALTNDIVGMSTSMQKCLNELADNANRMGEIINKHQEAINYLTQEPK